MAEFDKRDLEGFIYILASGLTFPPHNSHMVCLPESHMLVKTLRKNAQQLVSKEHAAPFASRQEWVDAQFFHSLPGDVKLKIAQQDEIVDTTSREVSSYATHVFGDGSAVGGVRNRIHTTVQVGVNDQEEEEEKIHHQDRHKLKLSCGSWKDTLWSWWNWWIEFLMGTLPDTSIAFQAPAAIRTVVVVDQEEDEEDTFANNLSRYRGGDGDELTRALVGCFKQSVRYDPRKYMQMDLSTLVLLISGLCMTYLYENKNTSTGEPLSMEDRGMIIQSVTHILNRFIIVQSIT